MFRFFALPADMANPPKTTTLLYEYVHAETGARAFTIDESWRAPGYRRTDKALCRVWRNPYTMPFPTGSSAAK